MDLLIITIEIVMMTCLLEFFCPYNYFQIPWTCHIFLVIIIVINETLELFIYIYMENSRGECYGSVYFNPKEIVVEILENVIPSLEILKVC